MKKLRFIILDFYGVLYLANQNALNNEIFEFISDHTREIGFGILSSGGSFITDMLEDKKLRHYFMFVKTAEELDFNKTDSRLYAEIAKDIAVAPHEILVVDDSSTNLEAAKQAKLQTLHYAQNKSFNEQIEKFIDLS